MQVFKLKKSNSEVINQAVNILKKGGVIVYPTETAYGMGCDATNTKAVAKIFAIKKRSHIKALALVVADETMAKKYTNITQQELDIVRPYWPGPLTIVTKRKNTLAKNLTPDDTVGIRVSGMPFVRQLVKKFGKPIVSTSANIANGPNPYSSKRIYRDFQKNTPQPDLLLDAGTLPRRKPSTIIKRIHNRPIILRQGSVIIQ